MHWTLDQIRREGLAALRRRLGRAGMVRFLQQFETGSGDYARERHAWVDQTTLEELKDISAKVGKGRPAAGRRKAGH
jgi:hypothetical protein